MNARRESVEDELDDFEIDELVVPVGAAEQPTAEEGAAGESLAAESGDVSGGDVSGGEPIREMVVPESARGMRLDLFLTHVIDGYSREQLRRAVQNDAAEVDGRVKRPSFRVKAGQTVRFRVPPPAADGPIPEAIPLDILYEDEGMVVVNKPPGMVVHPARGNWTGTLTSALAYHFQSLSDVGGPTRPGIVHRLDRDTSGVIVIAKTNAVHIHLAEQWAARTVSKTYLAVTAGRLDRDRDQIDAPIGRHPYQREKMAIRDNHVTSKPARTFYEVLERFHRFSFVRLSPETGRTHQIRVHLEHVGTPVLCDRLYGGRSMITAAHLESSAAGGVRSEGPPLLERQALHAARLELDHPQSGRRMVFEAPLPADMTAVLERLRELRDQ
ncbi:RluA family pseudouridine synthase [Candidatus Laterigemmans baculatus]|uniref:RluA family pseudouridine synthase n=1 Tax=Candidatus Laterigemmans baculatus TaxID=2770505 RepID=UPI001F3566BD|nr:RluA family pseudouridine synthase [Candidatus Laterigemmans baculatus]